MTIKQIVFECELGTCVQAEGWVRTKRQSKNTCFLELNDGSVLKGLQVVISRENDEAWQVATEVSTGFSLLCKGVLVSSPGAGQRSEMCCEMITIVGYCDSDFPLQKKHHSLEFLRANGHLRPRTNLIGAVMRVRSSLAFAIHSFFQDRGFQYVNTPIITTSDCEGAGDTFQVTTIDFDNPPILNERVDFSKDFFSQKAFLTVSGQLEGECYALALKNIYTFGPTFRAENSNTSRHLAEFWMVEPEMAFCTLEQVSAIAVDFIKEIFSYVENHCAEEMAFFDKFVLPGNAKIIRSVIEKPFNTVSYSDVIMELEKHNNMFSYPVTWGADIQTEHERFITENIFDGPTIVTDYPKELKAFYMKQNDDGRTVHCMDMLVPRLGEIIGCSQREDDYTKLRNRMLELGMNLSDYNWYLDLRRYGSVPHSGFGLGFERAVQYLTGVSNIRDVIPFPRWAGNAEF